MSLEEGRRDRDEALARVNAAADVQWKNTAQDTVMILAEVLPTFTSDDVWDRLADLKTSRPKEPRALGPIMLKLVRDGAIRPLGYEQSKRRQRHGAPVRVYEKVR